MGEKTKLSLNVDDLTLGDMEEFENATGQDIMEVMKPVPVIGDDGRPVKDPDDPRGRPLMQAKVTARAFVGLVYLALRKDNPNLSVAEVKAMKLSDIEFDFDQPAADENPTAESEAS